MYSTKPYLTRSCFLAQACTCPKFERTGAKPISKSSASISKWLNYQKGWSAILAAGKSPPIFNHIIWTLVIISCMR